MTRGVRSVGRGDRATSAALAVVVTLALSACAQREPDEQQVAEVVGKLPGVTSVNASFTGRSLGGGGDQKIVVEVASPPDAQQVEDLVRSLPMAVREVEHGDGYDEFTIATKKTGRGSDAVRSSSSLTYGPGLTPPGLATRWADAAGSTPSEGIHVTVPPSPRHTTASISAHEPVSALLTWALSTDLADLDWSIATYQTSSAPYVRFVPRRPLTVSMVKEWKAIEATIERDIGASSIARVVVVEDVEGVRKATVAVAFPAETSPLAEDTQGTLVWPIVQAISDSMPPRHRLHLQLTRNEQGARDQGSGDADLVKGGKGATEWEAAYRQRFPDAVPVSAPPT